MINNSLSALFRAEPMEIAGWVGLGHAVVSLHVSSKFYSPAQIRLVRTYLETSGFLFTVVLAHLIFRFKIFRLDEDFINSTQVGH
jgi:hypothetical protein